MRVDRVARPVEDEEEEFYGSSRVSVSVTYHRLTGVPKFERQTLPGQSHKANFCLRRLLLSSLNEPYCLPAPTVEPHSILSRCATDFQEPSQLQSAVCLFICF